MSDISDANRKLCEAINGASEAMAHVTQSALDYAEASAKLIDEILEQVDGVLYQDPIDGKTKFKLVRVDPEPTP